VELYALNIVDDAIRSDLCSMLDGRGVFDRGFSQSNETLQSRISRRPGLGLVSLAGRAMFANHGSSTTLSFAAPMRRSG
jgi:hypothetical protein